MSAYREGPRQPGMVAKTSWPRILRAWLRGTLRRAEERAFRNRVLRDPDEALRSATGGLAEVFRIAEVCNRYKVRVSPRVARVEIERIKRDEPRGDSGVITALDAIDAYEAITGERA